MTPEYRYCTRTQEMNKMKLIVGLTVVAVCNAASPIEKIIQLISALETKVIGKAKPQV